MVGCSKIISTTFKYCGPSAMPRAAHHDDRGAAPHPDLIFFLPTPSPVFPYFLFLIHPRPNLRFYTPPNFSAKASYNHPPPPNRYDGPRFPVQQLLSDNTSR